MNFMLKIIPTLDVDSTAVPAKFNSTLDDTTQWVRLSSKHYRYFVSICESMRPLITKADI